MTNIQHIIQIKTLGEFSMHVRGDCVGLHQWQSKRVYQMLLALVALGGKSVCLSRLADLLWGDAEGDKAMQNVEFNLRSLRRLLQELTDNNLKGNEIITLHQGHLSLNEQHCQIDTWLWQRLTHQASRLRQAGGADDQAFALERRALALLQGDFLPGQHDFIAPQCLDWRQQFSQWLAEMAYTWRRCELAKFDDVVHLIMIGQNLDPCSERLCIRAMYSLADKGYSVDALRVYYQWVERIKQEHGFNPSNKSSALARDILTSNR